MNIGMDISNLIYFLFDQFTLSVSADYAAKLEELEKSLAAPVMSSGFDDFDAVSEIKFRENRVN